MKLAQDMNVDEIFLKQAAEAIAVISSSPTHTDPIIRELLHRIRQSSPLSAVIPAPENVLKAGEPENMARGLIRFPETQTKRTGGNNHSKEGAQLYSCAKCQLKFSRSSDLRRHEKVHSLVLPHICSNCGKGFARKDALKRHSNTLTCQRNRKKLSEGSDVDVDELIKDAIKNGTGLL
ncbi:CHS_3a_G0055150.mRNA.1.CDS.1 [Saccharomyces cerevisiae]|nr:Met31p [Saccharomyces cerevisiae YJM1083]AJW23882.1 Met31p [Saccharomyces cerevisiae YJM681]CAI4904323.1 CHS_3a_G0055150.mRNA.1.CDS.1 [Saccharomyces cerevisiae]CAI7482834.1 CHS_3a_G0055150.mRNA.1.CDS.1 [Saccharomyces cerevisiae]